MNLDLKGQTAVIVGGDFNDLYATLGPEPGRTDWRFAGYVLLRVQRSRAFFPQSGFRA